jgi:hypothetical protein
MSSSVVFDNYYAVGSLKGVEVRASVLGAFALLGPALCANRILVPTPLEDDRSCFREGLEPVPKGRRTLFTPVDQRGALLRSVRAYLGPIWEVHHGGSASFPRTAQRSLYLLALANKYRATGVDVNPTEVLAHFNRLQPRRLKGEAGIRSREIAALFLSYSKIRSGRYAPVQSASQSELADALSTMLDSAELREIIAMQGRLGYISHPHAAVTSLVARMRKLRARHAIGRAVRVAGSVAAIGGTPVAAPLAETAAVALDEVGTEQDFVSHIFELPPSTRFGIVRSSIEAAFPGARFVQNYHWTHPPVLAGPNKCNGKHSSPAFQEHHLSRDHFCGAHLVTPPWGPSGPLDLVNEELDSADRIRLEAEKRLLTV